MHVCDIKREEGKNDNVFSLKRQGLAVLYMYFACLLLCTSVLVLLDPARPIRLGNQQAAGTDCAAG